MAFAGRVAQSVRRAYPEDEMGAAGLHDALAQMTAAFLPGGSEDLQRHPQWGIPKGSVVPAFVGSASNHLGFVTAAAGLPMDWAEIGGGAANGANAVRQFLRRLGGREWDAIDTGGPYWLSKQNHANIADGYAAGLASVTPPAAFNDYGYGTQPRGAPAQLGSDDGISPFGEVVVGVNPDEPVPPTWPPQQNKPVRYLSSRLRY
jgi:hypothetical protein